MGCGGNEDCSGRNAKTPAVANHHVPRGMVLIKYQSDVQGPHRVRGKSRSNYGIRDSGDIFKVRISDQEAEPERFVEESTKVEVGPRVVEPEEPEIEEQVEGEE